MYSGDKSSPDLKGVQYIHVIMLMNKYGYMAIGALGLLVALIAGSIFYFTSERGLEAGESAVSSETLQEFIERAREKVVTEIGQPIEGFEPFMFMRVYPGLTANDFDNVDALIGGYEYENGQVIYDLKGEPELHSAARAISDEGMATLLVNVATRLRIDLESPTLVDDVLATLEENPGPDPVSIGSQPAFNEFASITGKVICLPHKDRTGPQTLECALGIESLEGFYYQPRSLTDEFIPELAETGVIVTVNGILRVPSESNIYDITAIIDVESVEK